MKSAHWISEFILLAHAGPCSRTDPAQLIDRKGNRPWDSLISTASCCERCLDRKPGAWEDFVDRFLGLVVHVIHHTAQSRSVDADPGRHRRFGRRSVSDHHSGRLRDAAAFSRRKQPGHLPDRRGPPRRRPGTAQTAGHDQPGNASASATIRSTAMPPVEKRISNREEVERLLEELDSAEAEVVRLYHWKASRIAKSARWSACRKTASGRH